MTSRTTSAPLAPADPVARKPGPRGSQPLWRWVFRVAVAVQLVVLYTTVSPGGPEINGLDKVIHASIFLIPAFAALMLGIRARWVVGILALHAPLSELLQHHLLPRRDGDVFDVMADLGGLVLGSVAYVVWIRRHP